MKEIDDDIIKAAVETYNLEKALDPDSSAIESALKAAMIVIQQQTMDEIALAANELAEHILNEEDPSYEGASVLQIFAKDIQDQIPKVGKPYEPEDDDIVVVSLVGEVTVFYEECPNCGQLQDVRTWSVKDRATGEEYFFDEHKTRNIRARVISPGGIDEMLPSPS